MRFLASLLTCLFLYVLPFLSPLSAQDPEDAVFDIMDPETVFSFSGLDGKDFIQRQPVNLPQPPYVDETTGVLALRFEITAEGRVQTAELEPAPIPLATPKMEQAALDAIKQWKFAPVKAGSNIPVPTPMRVVLQFNRDSSNILYSTNGLHTIEGLHGRLPAKLVAPQATQNLRGVVRAQVIISPAGYVRAVYRYRGAYESSEIPPRLGIACFNALKQWTFDALPPEALQVDQEISITLRFLGNGGPLLR